MMADVRDAINILREEGFSSLCLRASSRIRRWIQNVYWRVVDKQELNLNGTTVEFSTPERKVAQRNLSRFESEQEIILDILQSLESGDVFYDIGANTGLFTLFVAKSKPDVNVVSFEPYPPNVELLRRNLSRNEVNNVDLKDIALSDSNDVIQFDQPASDDFGYGSATIAADDNDGTVDVVTKRGDQLIENDEIPRPNVLKIDVEGSEPLVLEGLLGALESRECRVLYLEVHLPGQPKRPAVTDFGSSEEQIKGFIESRGFDTEVINRREHELFLKAEKPT